MGKRRKRELDGPLILVGYLCLAASIYCLWLGLGVAFASTDGADPAEMLPGPGAEAFWTFSTVATIVVFLGLGCALAAVWWWLAGLPIRRWWWRRQDRKAQQASERG